MTPSTSPSEFAGRGGRGLAVIDTPAAPPGWEDARSQLIRVVDPLGGAVAWLAPAAGGRCVGFAVRLGGAVGTPWFQVFHAATTGTAPSDPRAAGCGLACAPAAGEPGDDLAAGAAWRLDERDPTAAALVATSGEPAGVSLRFSAALDDGMLTLAAAIGNRATGERRLRLGLLLALGDGVAPAAVDGGHLASARIVRLAGFGPALVVEVALVAGVSRPVPVARRDPGRGALLAPAADSAGGIATLAPGATLDLIVTLRAFPG